MTPAARVPAVPSGRIQLKKEHALNKAQLIETMAGKEGLTKAAAGRVLDDLMGTIAGTLAKGDDVTLIGFGRFVVKETAARKGRNPQTGAEVKIPAKRVPRFIPGAGFRAAVAIKAKKK